MAQEESDRLDLFTRLEQVIGPVATRTLMERLPAMPWSDLATKQDVLLVKQDVVQVRQELAGVKQDVAQVRQDLERSMQELEARMNERIDSAKFELLAAFRGELNAAITSQTRTMVMTMIATVIAVTSLVLTLSPAGAVA